MSHADCSTSQLTEATSRQTHGQVRVRHAPLWSLRRRCGVHRQHRVAAPGQMESVAVRDGPAELDGVRSCSCSRWPACSRTVARVSEPRRAQPCLSGWCHRRLEASCRLVTVIIVVYAPTREIAVSLSKAHSRLLVPWNTTRAFVTVTSPDSIAVGRDTPLRSPHVHQAGRHRAPDFLSAAQPHLIEPGRAVGRARLRQVEVRDELSPPGVPGREFPFVRGQLGFIRGESTLVGSARRCGGRFAGPVRPPARVATLATLDQRWRRRQARTRSPMMSRRKVKPVIAPPGVSGSLTCRPKPLLP